MLRHCKENETTTLQQAHHSCVHGNPRASNKVSEGAQADVPPGLKQQLIQQTKTVPKTDIKALQVSLQAHHSCVHGNPRASNKVSEDAQADVSPGLKQQLIQQTKTIRNKHESTASVTASPPWLRPWKQEGLKQGF